MYQCCQPHKLNYPRHPETKGKKMFYELTFAAKRTAASSKYLSRKYQRILQTYGIISESDYF